MFTSRAEYRLILREDNADLRLTEKGRELGVVDDERWNAFSKKREAIEIERARLDKTWIQPKSEQAAIANKYLEHPLNREYSLSDLMRRPELDYPKIAEIGNQAIDDNSVAEQIEIQVKYEGYITRQQEEIERLKRHENTVLPIDFDYDNIPGLSNELTSKLKDVRPETIAQASRIPGVTPAAVSLLVIYLKKRSMVRKEIA